MITMTDLRVANAAQTDRRFDVPAARYGISGVVVRTRGWQSAGTGLASFATPAAPDSAPLRGSLH